MTEPALRLLFVRPKSSGNDLDGDNVVHLKAIRHLSATMNVRVAELETAKGPIRLLNLCRSGPPEIARHMSSENQRILLAAVHDFSPDVICLCNETSFPLATLAKQTNASVILYAHNVHSRILDMDKDLASVLFMGATRRFEHRYYADLEMELVCISASDSRYLRQANIRASTVFAPPGAPPDVPLAKEASVEAALVVTGSYGWWRKRRDLRRFAAEASDPAVPCYVSEAAANAALIPGAQSILDLNWGSAIRFGVITDRFAGGFKLKSTEYIAQNCAILSFADIYEDFDGLPHAAEFVRTVESRAEAQAVARNMAIEGDHVVDRFIEFKTACLARFDWSRTLDPLEATIRRAQRKGFDEIHGGEI